MGPLKNMAAPSPAKTQAHEMHEKAGSISNTCARAPLRGDMNKRLSTKPGWGRTAPLVQHWIIRMYIIMTAANCSPAVASRRAKYDDDFRVPTLLDAQPLDHEITNSSRHITSSRHNSTGYRNLILFENWVVLVSLRCFDCT